MNSSFFIELNMRTGEWFERFGCLELGSDREFALKVFAGLKGSPAVDETGVLQMDLVEKRNGLPMNMQVIQCSADELSANVKYVAHELFKRINLALE